MSIHGVSSNSQSLDQDKVKIVVKGQDQREMPFTISRDKKLNKLLETYCQRREINIGSVVFLYKGSRIHGYQTPKELKIKKSCEINAMTHQTGGGGGASPNLLLCNL